MAVVDRCRNCGIRGHQTQNCPSWGPLYPAPGKTREDYAKQNKKIQDKLARDIVEEHLGHEIEEEPTIRRSRAKAAPESI